MAPTDLPVRAETRELPPRSVGDDLTHRTFLRVGAFAETWRIIQAMSFGGRPFQLEVQWSSGDGDGPVVPITVSHATRVCVIAQELVVRAANLSDTPNQVAVTITDGFCHSRNQYEAAGVSLETPVILDIPPFASRFLVELDRPSWLRRARIEILDGLRRVRSMHLGHRQPRGGIPVGGASRLRLWIPERRSYRVVFELTL